MQANGQVTTFEQPSLLLETCMDFSPISLAEMNRVKLLDHFDRKYVLPIGQLFEIQQV